MQENYVIETNKNTHITSWRTNDMPVVLYRLHRWNICFFSYSLELKTGSFCFVTVCLWCDVVYPKTNIWIRHCSNLCACWLSGNWTNSRWCTILVLTRCRHLPALSCAISRTTSSLTSNNNITDVTILATNGFSSKRNEHFISAVSSVNCKTNPTLLLLFVVNIRKASENC